MQSLEFAHRGALHNALSTHAKLRWCRQLLARLRIPVENDVRELDLSLHIYGIHQEWLHQSCVVLHAQALA